jgi:hypothetical protein
LALVFVFIILSAGFSHLGINYAVAQEGYVLADSPGVRVGPVRLHPGVGVSETYTSNLYLEPDEIYDWITTISPFLEATLPFRRHEFVLNYQTDIVRHAREEDQDYEEHFVSGLFTFDFPGGLVVEAGHEWAALTNVAVSEFDNNHDYKSNVSTLDMEYQFANRWSVGVGYGHEFERFDNDFDELDDRDVDDIALRLFYRIFPKTSVFLEGGWQYERFPERDLISTDSYEYRVWGGVRTTPAAKIVGSIGGGYSKRDWVGDDAGDNVDAFTISGDLFYDLTPRTRLSLRASRSIQSTTITTTDTPVFGSSYTETLVSVGVSQAFTPRFTTSASVTYGLSEFSGEGAFADPGLDDREDDRFQGELALRYRAWKYLGLGLSYRYSDNNSNFDPEDYTEHSAMFTISFRL